MLLISCFRIYFGCIMVTVILLMTACVVCLARGMWLLMLCTSSLGLIVCHNCLCCTFEFKKILLSVVFNLSVTFLTNKRVHIVSPSSGRYLLLSSVCRGLSWMYCCVGRSRRRQWSSADEHLYVVGCTLWLRRLIVLRLPWQASLAGQLRSVACLRPDATTEGYDPVFSAVLPLR